MKHLVLALIFSFLLAGCGSLQFNVDKYACAILEFRVMGQPDMTITKEFCDNDITAQVKDFLMSREGFVYQVFVVGTCKAYECAEKIQDVIDGKKIKNKADEEVKSLLTK